MILLKKNAKEKDRGIGKRRSSAGPLSKSERLFLSQFRLSQKYRGQKRVLFARVHRRRRGGQRAYTTAPAARKKPAKTQRAIVACRPSQRKKRHDFARRAVSCRSCESCRISRTDKARQRTENALAICRERARRYRRCPERSARDRFDTKI